MKVEFVHSNELKKIEDVKSGTLVQYGSETEVYGYGIVLKDMDNDSPIIYCIQDNCYYTDCAKYYIWHTPSWFLPYPHPG